LHPADAHELRKLGERLCDFSWGRPFDRDEFEYNVEALMVRVRSDCSPVGATRLSDRLLGMADWRSGSEVLAEMALVEILLGDTGPARMGL
jgi:hypothetical protein